MHLVVSGYGSHRGLQVTDGSRVVGELKFPVFRERGTIWRGVEEYDVRSKRRLLGTRYRLEQFGVLIADIDPKWEIGFAGKRYKMKPSVLISLGPPDVLLVGDLASGEQIGSIVIAHNAAQADFVDGIDLRLALFLLWLAGRAIEKSKGGG